MTRRTHQTTKLRSRSLLTKAVVLAAIGSVVLTACADSPASTTATTSAAASGSAAPATLSVSDTGTFKGLVTSSDVITPTVNGNTVTINLGGQPVTVDKDKKLKVGFFVNGAQSLFFQTAFAWAKAQADAYGYDIEEVDGAYDTAKQSDQIETAINTKKYDAIIIIPVDGIASCDALTKQAPAAGIIVVNYFNPICGKSADPVQNWSVPGILGAVGGGTSVPVGQAFAEKVFAATPQGKGMSLSIGEALCTCAAIFAAGLDGAQKAYPDVNLTRLDATTVDASGGQAVTEQYLKDNPDANFIIALSDDTGLGAVEAIKAAGLTGKVKVYMAGGTQQIVDSMKAGTSDGTYPYYMGNAAQTALLMLHEAVAGNPVPTVIANDGAPLASYAEQVDPFFTYVTPEIVTSGGFVPNTAQNAQAAR